MVLLYLIASLLFEAVKFHLVFCLILFIVHEAAVYLLAKRIYDNGWIDKEEIDNAFADSSKIVIKNDIEYYSYLLVPGINILVIYDIFYQATHKAEDEKHGKE